MSERDLLELKRSMREVARSLLDLEEEFNKQCERDFPGKWFPGKLASSVLDHEREDRKQEAIRASHKVQFQEMARIVQEQGYNPQEVFTDWEWKDGEPTGNYFLNKRERKGDGT